MTDGYNISERVIDYEIAYGRTISGENMETAVRMDMKEMKMKATTLGKICPTRKVRRYSVTGFFSRFP